MPEKEEKPGALEEALGELGEKIVAWSKRRWKKWKLQTKLFGGLFLVALLACFLINKIPFRSFALAFFAGATFVMFWNHLAQDEFKKEKKTK